METTFLMTLLLFTFSTYAQPARPDIFEMAKEQINKTLSSEDCLGSKWNEDFLENNKVKEIIINQLEKNRPQGHGPGPGPQVEGFEPRNFDGSPPRFDGERPDESKIAEKIKEDVEKALSEEEFIAELESFLDEEFLLTTHKKEVKPKEVDCVNCIAKREELDISKNTGNLEDLNEMIAESVEETLTSEEFEEKIANIVALEFEKKNRKEDKESNKKERREFGDTEDGMREEVVGGRSLNSRSGNTLTASTSSNSKASGSYSNYGNYGNSMMGMSGMRMPGMGMSGYGNYGNSMMGMSGMGMSGMGMTGLYAGFGSNYGSYGSGNNMPAAINSNHSFSFTPTSVGTTGGANTSTSSAYSFGF